MEYQKIQVPTTGDKITANADMSLSIPKNPAISFIEDDGIGVDISPVMIEVIDAVMEEAYKGERKIAWMEVYAGGKAVQVCDQDTWLPQEALDAVRNYVVSIKDPLTIPTGGGIHSLDAALRQRLDLYVCQRPICWFEGVPSPVKRPGDIDIAVFRENSEDIYAGVEWKAGSSEAEKVIKFLTEEVDVKKVRFTENCGIGIEPISQEDAKRLAREALQYAVGDNRSSTALVHKGNITRFTEGAFKDWGYEVAHGEFSARLLNDGSRVQFKNPETGKSVIVKDVITDVVLQQILLRPARCSVVATLNLNGDYLSNALTAKVGDIGIAPGANLSDSVAMFEATRGTAPKYVDQDEVSPGSLILSTKMMLHHMSWTEATGLIIKGTNGAIAAKTMTYDLERLMDGATLLSCLEFGDAMIAKI